MPENDPFLNTVEAAAYVRIDPRTFEAWRRQGRGPIYHKYTARCVRYRRSDLDRWLNERRVESRRARPNPAKGDR
jgi:hypothetical protein